MQFQKQLSPWGEDDLKQHKALDELLSKCAKWNLTTAESVQLYRSLVWYAQLRERINGSIAEITRVVEPNKDYKPAETKETGDK